MANGSGNLVSRAARIKEMVEGPMAVLGIWTKPNRMLVIRSGNPLHFCSLGDGLYFASLPNGMPGKRWSLPDDYVRILKN